VAKAEGSLKRLGGGRWETRDGRFAIEPQSGTWVIVDNESTDELGLPLVRGPYASLTAAKDAIESVRDGVAVESPLAERLAAAAARAVDTGNTAKKGGRRTKATAPEPPPPPPEPRWLTDLDAPDRRRAREWIERLEGAGFTNAEEIARDEVARGRPAVVRAVLARELAEAAGSVDREAIKAVITLLTDGADRALGVRWRLVDDDARAVGSIDLPG
jgi:hypothetical protein